MTIAEPAARADAISIRATVWAQFEQVAREQEKSLPPLSDDLVLADTDLDSLCFAVIVARLEDTLGFDPFTLAEDAVFPVTLRDFVTFYETYADGAS
jgi:acyl carrier protein